MDEVMVRMRDLATHRGDDSRRSKRDRSALKTTFRDLISSVEVPPHPTPSRVRAQDLCTSAVSVHLLSLFVSITCVLTLVCCRTQHR